MRKNRLVVTIFVCACLLAACTGAKRPEGASDTVSAGALTDSSAVEDAATVSEPTLEAPLAEADPGAPASASAASAPGKAGGPAGATATTVAAGGPTPAAAPAGGVGDSNGDGIVSAPPATQLFTEKEDTVGMTKTSLTLCAHAALTYGAAFNTGVDDLKVYFDAINAEQGGIHGRKVTITYENDNYDPQTAVQAATTCKAKNPFLLLGGIGFDQIPAVRNWAENERMLYVHHTATVNGSDGKQFSFTPLPSTEKMGEVFGELAATRFKGKTVGIIKRNSPNWEPGVDAFKAIAAQHGIKIVAERAVQANKRNYIEDILAMSNAGADVVWAWENALASTEIIKQAKAQQYSPTWMVFPFNLTSQTLGDEAMSPKLAGVAMFTAYSYGDHGGPFAPYADDMREFERHYAKYRPTADIRGLAGDLLFLNWTAMKALHLQLLECGPDCTRNRFIDVMINYRKRPTSSSCEIDHTRGNNRHGGYFVNIMETYRAPGDKVNWRNTDTCVEHLL